MLNRVQEFRKEKGYTQTELAQLADVSIQTIQRLESTKGQTIDVYISVGLKIARALNTTVEEIFKIEKEEIVMTIQDQIKMLRISGYEVQTENGLYNWTNYFIEVKGQRIYLNYTSEKFQQMHNVTDNSRTTIEKIIDILNIVSALSNQAYLSNKFAIEESHFLNNISKWGTKQLTSFDFQKNNYKVLNASQLTESQIQEIEKSLEKDGFIVVETYEN